MIVLFGQPHSGKTTLAKKLQQKIFIDSGFHIPIIDGDEIRDIFKNKDYSKQGRINNLKRIGDIATYLFHKYEYVIVSAVFPYREARDYVNSINEEYSVKWVYLYYNEDRGREGFHVKDFDYPIDSNEQILSINTDEDNEETCLNKIEFFYKNQTWKRTN